MSKLLEFLLKISSENSELMRKIRVPGSVSRAASKLDKKKKYLQIALNSTLEEAEKIIFSLPVSDRIILEAGTPLIKRYGIESVVAIQRASLSRSLSNSPYIVADTKTADLGEREVKIFAEAGASAATCLGVAPIKTVEYFIAACRDYGLESMIDMMNVADPSEILRKLKNLPDVVIVHRGVDETEKDKSKPIPYYQINQLKGGFGLMMAVAGGDSPREMQSAVFNGADIVVLWKDFYSAEGNIRELAENFLQEIR